MSDVSATELFESNNDSLQLKIHTSLPAKVVSFNPSEQTVTIELMITQMAHDDSMLELPPLVDVPVQMFSYGEFFITSEPKEGDEGMAYFSERCIDGWWESGQKSIPMDVRFHDFSDAHFVGGTKSKPNALTIIPNCLNLGGASAYIRINADGTIEIKGATNFLNNVTAPDFVTDSGISLNNHLTTGVKSGTDTSGIPTAG